MIILTEEEIYTSYEAVRLFLMDEEPIDLGRVPCYFITGELAAVTNIDITKAGGDIPSYTIKHQAFTSFGLNNPIKSAYKLLKWDLINRELVIEIHKRQKIRLKRR